MTETSATDNLRRLLDGLRGVGNLHDFAELFGFDWNDDSDWTWHDVAVKMADDLEQAIAATLGSGVERSKTEYAALTTEQVREAIFNGSSYASYDGAKYYADGIGMQAIADELNAELVSDRAEFDGIPMTEENMGEHGWVRERTCRLDGTLYYDGTNAWFHELSCGHEVETLDREPPSYCPECGAKVVD